MNAKQRFWFLPLVFVVSTTAGVEISIFRSVDEAGRFIYSATPLPQAAEGKKFIVPQKPPEESINAALKQMESMQERVAARLQALREHRKAQTKEKEEAEELRRRDQPAAELQTGRGASRSHGNTSYSEIRWDGDASNVPRSHGDAIHSVSRSHGDASYREFGSAKQREIITREVGVWTVGSPLLPLATAGD